MVDACTALRFLEDLLSLWRRHLDHEPWKAPASRAHSKRFAKSQALGHCAAAFGLRGACSRFRTRFKERSSPDSELVEAFRAGRGKAIARSATFQPVSRR